MSAANVVRAVAMGVLAVLLATGSAGIVALYAVAFALGMAVFCGSLYALALGAPRWFGAITPLGGVAFIVGWLALGVALAPLLAARR